MRHATAVAREREDRGIKATFLSHLAAHKQDLAARLSDGRSYTPEEAFDLIWFVSQADLRYRGLPDYSSDALTLLQQALERKVVDPNGGACKADPGRR